MKHLYLVILTGLFVTTSVTAHAEKIYKWQDDDGSWNYSEVPPVEKEAETLKIKVSPKSSEGINTTSSVIDTKNSAESRKEKVNPESEPETAYTPEEIKANCSLATKRLGGLETHPRVLITDEKTGDKRYLSPDEHKEWSTKSKKEIEEFCKK
jgi:hypothetical protein